MKIEALKYKITLVIDNLITNNLDTVHKRITRKNIELETGVPKEIDKRDLIDYFSRELKNYCSKNKVSMDNLTLDGYEIESQTKGVEVYFDSDSLNYLSFEPKIMAKLIPLKDMPIINAEQLDDYTIKWSWEDNGSVNYLKDESGNIIEQLPLNVNYYIETGLTPGETYTRFLTTTNMFNEILESAPCIITLEKREKANIYQNFKVEDRNEDIEELDTNYASRLKAFASGVGDNNDCLIVKSDDLKLSRNFKLYNKIYGIRASNDIMHHTIKFKYRYKLVGEVPYLTYKAKFKVKVTATECVPMSMDPDPTLFGSPIVSKELIYTLDDYTQIANIYLYQLLPELEKSYKKRYKFDVEITPLHGKARVFMHDRGYHNLIAGKTVNVSFTEKGYFDHMFYVAAIAQEEMKEYIEYYPDKKFDPLTGWVNGNFEESADGIRDTTDIMYSFTPSPAVTNIKYYLEFEEIKPNEAYVRYQFENQIPNTNYTLTNGDKVRFYSSAIFADSTEHREFITQTVEGPYIINDNKKHSYTYDIKDIKLNVAGYKRFELEVVPNINDIVMLSYPTEINMDVTGNVDMNVTVSCRNMQNAIAKWSPKIHNGYYYFNQDEYFLYSQCATDNLDLELNQAYETKNVRVKAVLYELGPEIEERDYDIQLKTRDELLLDDYHYEFEDNKIWPKPIEVYNTYYQEYAAQYEYYSKPFTFDFKPTSYKSFTWDEAGMPNSEIEAYAIAYDDVYGVWYPPVRITNGGPIPSTLKLSRILMLKFIMKPSRRPKIEEHTTLLCCESDWKNSRLKFLSRNIYFREETLMPTSKHIPGIFMSQFIDLGDTASEIKERSIKFDPTYEGTIKFYVTDSDTKVGVTDIVEYKDWVEVQPNTEYKCKRFVRYKIVFAPCSKLYYMNLIVKRYTYNGMGKEEYLPGLGNIRVQAETKSNLTGWMFEHTDGEGNVLEKHFSTTYPICSTCGAGGSNVIITPVQNRSVVEHEYITSYALKYDEQPHILVEDMKEFINNVSDAVRVNPASIFDVNFFPYDAVNNDFEIKKEPNSATIKSLNTILDYNIINKTQNGVLLPLRDNKVSCSPVPQQFAPIIIYEPGDEEPYTQVFFKDENNKYTLTNVEEFESLGFKTLYLKYLNIDPTSVEIYIDESIEEDYKIINNVIEFENKIPAGAKIVVKYKILKSFIANYDYHNDKVNFEIFKATGSYTNGGGVVAGHIVCGTNVVSNSTGSTIVGHVMCGNQTVCGGTTPIDSIPVKEIRVFYETDKIYNSRPLTDISLNPIYSLRYNGYIFICDYQDEPHKINIYPEDTYIFANGENTMNVLVQVLDKNNNPVENIAVNIISAQGRIRLKNNRTDGNGIIHCIYRSCNDNVVDEVKAIVNNKVKNQCKIINRKL